MTGTDASGPLVINDAPRRIDRARRPLAPGYAPVDGRGFAELTAFAAGVAALVRYWSPADVEDGRWEAFFLQQPVPVLAMLGGSGGGRLGAALTALERPEGAAAEARLGATIRLLHRVGCAWAQWPRLAGRPGPGAAAQPSPAAVERIGRDTVAPALRRLAALDRASAVQGGGAGLDWSGFPADWGLAAVTADTAVLRGRDGALRVAALFEALRPVAAALETAADSLGIDTGAAIDARLGAGMQPPHLALHMAFDRLYGTAQDGMNRFGRRLVDFYYRDLLREGERGPQADQVFLTVALADGVRSASLPKGTALAAGTDAGGSDILYRTRRTLDATAAGVAALRTLRTVRGNPFGGDRPPVPCACYAAEPPLPGDDGPPAPWPLLGFAPGDAWPWSPAPEPVAAALGFAIATPTLWLGGGARTVTLGIGWDAAYWSGALEPRLAAIAAATGATYDGILAALWTAMLRLELTTATGWVAVPHSAAVTRSAPVDITPPPADGMTLTVELPATAPAVAPLPPPDPAATAPPVDPEPGVPALAAWIAAAPVSISGPSGTMAVPPLAILDGLRPCRLDVAVSVTGMPVGTLANTDGDIDPSAPFPVFGGLPVVGSGLELRCRELFVKVLGRLDLTIGWFDIPGSETGFKGYYKAYVLGPEGGPPLVPYDNAVFRTTISVTGKGPWTVTGDGLCLFRSKGEPVKNPVSDSALDPTTVFKALPVSARPADPFFDPDKAVLRMELAGPATAFGNDIYARNVMKAVIDALPKPPPAPAEAKVAAENAAVLEAAEFVQEALQSCAGEPSDGYRAAVGRALDDCVGYLVLGVSQALVSSYETAAAAGALSDGARTTLRDHAKAVGATEGRARLDRLEAWLTDAVLLTGERAGPALRRGKALLEALKALVQRTDDCARQPGDLYRDCMEVALERCHEYLEQAYEDCVAVSVRHAASAEPVAATEMVYPNKPWQPQATTVLVGYGATGVALGPGADGYGAARLHHLGPFGITEPAGRVSPPLVAVPDADGALMIGIDGATLPQPLDLLLRLATAAGRGDPPAVAWALRTGPGWTPLTGTALRLDGTRGLACTGILGFALPDAAATGTDGRLWLRASAQGAVDRFPPGVAITANAVEARWDPDAGGAAERGTPLPAGTITALVQPRADVASIDQPLPSTGGVAPETAAAMEIRVGERLRHKARAIQPWDMERMTLERFPVVWQVKAMPARGADGQSAAGSVLVAVVPGADAPGPPDPLVPAADGALLERVRAHLAASASAFLSIRAVNPLYVRVTVTARVALADETDRGAAVVALDADLRGFLSPWYAGSDPARRFTPAAIATFLRGRPAVASVLSVALREEPARDTLPWCLLTSAEHHVIEVVATGDCARLPARTAPKWRRLADDA